MFGISDVVDCFGPTINVFSYDLLAPINANAELFLGIWQIMENSKRANFSDLKMML